jgi:hypothetical protein
MKAQILKIAGVKTEAEFYKKYPTEEAFMKKHGKEFKKAQTGTAMRTVNKYLPEDTPEKYNQDIAEYEAPPLDDFQKLQEKVYANKAEQNNTAALANMLGVGQETQTNLSLDGADNSKKFKLKPDLSGALESALPQVGDIMGLVKQIDQKKKDITRAKVYKGISDVQAQADTLNKLNKPKPKFLRPEFQPLQPNQLTNPYGSGTNYLAKNGAQIQNTYASTGDLYSDLGYVPQRAQLGSLLKGSGGMSGGLSSLTGGLGSVFGGGKFQTSPESQLGGAVGNIVGLATGLPPELVGAVGAGIGGYFGGESAKELEKLQVGREANAQAMAFTNNFVANNPHMERGGYISNNWQPQVITKFGDLDVSQVHSFAHDSMPQYRAGGHMSQYTPPSAEALFTGRTMEDGGEIQTLWGGGLKTMAHNSKLGPLHIIKGNKHKESDGKGNYGVGIKYGKGVGPGSIVEAQDDEPIVELADGGSIDPMTGGPSKSAVVFGKEKILGWGKKAIGDKDIKPGMTFERYVAEKGKQQQKANKMIDKGSQLINMSDPDDRFEALAANSGDLLQRGGKMLDSQIADYISNAGIVQTAINETDEEFGTTAKYGKKLKKAEFGTRIQTADGGKNLSSLNVQPIMMGLLNLLYSKGYDMGNMSGLRKGAKTKQGRDSRHGKGQAVDITFPALGKKAYEAIANDPEIVDYMRKNNLTVINEYDPKIMKKTGATGPHLHFGLDQGTALSNAFRKKVGGYNKIPGMNFGDNWDTERQVWQPSNIFPLTPKYNFNPNTVQDSWADDGSAYWKPKLGVPQDFGNVRGATTLLGKDYDPGYNPRMPWELPTFDWKPSEDLVEKRTVVDLSTKPKNLGAVRANPAKQKNNSNVVVQDGNTPNKPNGKENQSVTAPASSAATSTGGPLQTPAATSSSTPYTNSSSITSHPDFGGGSIVPVGGTTGGTSTSGGLQAVTPADQPKWWEKSLMSGIRSALPYLRPSNQRDIDPRQLAGEMYALSNNEQEPVQAQLYNPYLTQPVSISLQDQLNEITSQSRAAERMAGYDPAAASQIAAGAYNAKNKVLGEQFRMNQAEQARAYEANRQALNEAQKVNLGILDQQYVRQQQAKSKTKEQAIAALNSINDKIVQSKLANQTLGIMENMYNFRFAPGGQAINTNIAGFNTPTVGTGISDVNDLGLTKLEIQEAQIKAAKEKLAAQQPTKTVAQGGIVKAFKDL